MSTYSFLSFNCTLSGPGGQINIDHTNSVAEEGISFDPVEDVNTMTIGAGGQGMHSLHAGQAVEITVRLLKTSPANGPLSDMYNAQTANPALHGANIVSGSDIFRGDKVTCTQVAFKRKPNLTFAKVGGLNEWKFDAVVGTYLLGSGG